MCPKVCPFELNIEKYKAPTKKNKPIAKKFAVSPSANTKGIASGKVIKPHKIKSIAKAPNLEVGCGKFDIETFGVSTFSTVF